MLLKPNAFSLHTSLSASCVLGTVLHVWRLCCGQGRGRDQTASEPHQGPFRSIQETSECCAKIKCDLRGEEATRDTDYERKPGPPTLDPTLPTLRPGGLLKPSARVSYSALLCCLPRLCACTRELGSHVHVWRAGAADKCPRCISGAVKAPCLMAGAAVVTAVIGDFTGSFTSLASSFGDDFIIPSTPPPSPSAVVRRGGGVQSSGWGTGWQNEPEAQAEGGAGPGVGSQVRAIPSCPAQSQRAGGSGVRVGGEPKAGSARGDREWGPARARIWKPGGHSSVRSGTLESVKGLPKWS